MFRPSAPGMFLRSFYQPAMRQHYYQCQADDENGDTDQHARGQTVMDMVGRIIAAEIFHDRAREGITDEVRGKNLPVEFFASEQPGKQEIKQKIVCRVINLRGMHRHAGVLVAGRKLDAPRQIGWPAIAAPVEKTADAAKNVAQ